MISGILKVIRNSGELATIMAEIIYEKDKFDYKITENGVKFTHKPLMLGSRGKMLGVYAFAKMKDGSTYVEILSMDDINKIKSCSRGGNSGPWKSFETEMMKKSAIRRLAKRLPMSTDIEKAVKDVDDFYEFEKPPIRTVKEEVHETSTPRLSQLIEGNTEEKGEGIDARPTESNSEVV